jgi:hypothetical protein
MILFEHLNQGDSFWHCCFKNCFPESELCTREVFREASIAKGAEGVLFSAREVLKNSIDGSFELMEFFKKQGSFKNVQQKKENGFQVPFLFVSDRLLFSNLRPLVLWLFANGRWSLGSLLACE